MQGQGQGQEPSL